MDDRDAGNGAEELSARAVPACQLSQSLGLLLIRGEEQRSLVAVSLLRIIKVPLYLLLLLTSNFSEQI